MIIKRIWNKWRWNSSSTEFCALTRLNEKTVTEEFKYEKSHRLTSTFQELLDEEFQQKIQDARQLLEDKTAKKRAKRLKKKQNMKKKGKKVKTDEKEEEEEENSESEESKSEDEEKEEEDKEKSSSSGEVDVASN